MKFSQRLMRLKPSATRAMADRAAKLKAEGRKVISFTTGEPDFPSPPAAIEYARKALDENKIRYTTTSGTSELKAAIIKYYQERHGLAYSPDEIIVSAGAKSVLYEALGALVDSGDEVIVPTPAWVSYVEQVDAFDGKAVLVDTSNNGFMPRIEDVENALTAKTVAIMLNTPHNPTGVIYDRVFMRDLCRLALQRNFIIINDEIYERLTYGQRYTNPLTDVPEARDVVLTVNGASKTYAMTGWRVGFALGPVKLINKINVLQGHITSSVCSVSQKAAVGAILHAQDYVEDMVKEYARRRDFLCREIASMPHVSLTEPKGAFYAFLDLRPAIGKRYENEVIADDNAFCELLLEHGLMALVPGTAFLAPGFARLSYAVSMEELRTGMDSLRAFLTALR